MQEALRKHLPFLSFHNSHATSAGRDSAPHLLSPVQRARHEFNSTKEGVPTHLGSVCAKCHQDVPPSLCGRKMTLRYG